MWTAVSLSVNVLPRCLIGDKKIKDNSYSEFQFSFQIVECYDDTYACLFALKNVTLIEMVV